jgi:tRNA threonylcarbamoyladenosine biosynthesis protein TsaB
VFHESRYILWNQELRDCHVPFWHQNCSSRSALFLKWFASFSVFRLAQVYPAERDTRHITKYGLECTIVLILALDTCDARGGVALLRGESLLRAEPHGTSEDYSSWLLPAVERVLAPNGLTLRDIELYAVAAGPGSFTGVRVGLTTVKAWSEVYGRPIASVSRLEALASEGVGSSPYVAAFIDARRDQIFAALYRRQAAALERIDHEMVIASEKFVEWCAAKAGSDSIDWISADPACLTKTPQWPARLASKETLHEVSALLSPRIGQLGHRLACQNRLTDALSLDANYVRRSDAELFWKGPSHYAG